MQADQIIAQAKSQAEMHAAQLLHTFSFVPDDKLNWSPSESCKSALRIVAHCAVSNHGISRMIRGENFEGDPTEVFKAMAASELEITTREQAISAMNESLAVVLSSLDTVTDERIGSVPESPMGPLPMMFWVTLPAMHMMGHSYQVDFLQTVWGDHEFHCGVG
jgi:hypothetical protein